MKKLIIILSILILVVCSTFAGELHVIRLKSMVDSKSPIFVLKAGLAPDDFDRAVSDAEADNMLSWETVEKSIKEEDVVVYFEVVQRGDAKEVGQKYSLTIEASEMTLGFNEDGSMLAPNADIYKTSKGKISNVTAMSTERAVVAVSNVRTIASDSATIVAEYHGLVNDGTPIAKFTVTWPKDIDAPDGIYQASVILKVSQQ